MAVLKGNDAPGGIAAFHRVKYLVPGGVAHSLGVGKQRPEGDVGKGTLHALIGGAVLAQHHGFVLLCHVHQVLHVILIIGPQGGRLNAGRSLFQHCCLAGSVVNGQAVGSFVFGHLQHSGHPPLKQCGKLGIHCVDLGACLFQCVHGFTSFLYGSDRPFDSQIPSKYTITGTEKQQGLRRFKGENISNQPLVKRRKLQRC